MIDLPISENKAIQASKWLIENFGKSIDEAVHKTPFSVNLICAIACQETAYKWLLWIDKYKPGIVLGRCVLDASGDFPNTTRNAFPKNATAFQNVYGQSFLNELINEANLQRAMPQSDSLNGYKPAKYLYKGYGIFQYDLQAVKNDVDFFKLKKWYNIEDCLKKLLLELNIKSKQFTAEKDFIAAYNGSGPKAKVYSENVLAFKEIIA